MVTLFIADLHLSSRRPEKITLFKQFLQGPARAAAALYILGDLFDDFWIGCDNPKHPQPEVLAALHDYAQLRHTQLWVMPGNRDFHLNQRFASATGSRLINDPQLITLANKKILLMHGDTLCSDDIHYQRWRQFITQPAVKWLFAKMPLIVRQRLAGDVRSYTAAKVKAKPRQIMDVAAATVMNVINQYDVDILIHGHTHRQAMHTIDIAGKQAQRIVLGDWLKDDSVLIHDDDGFRFARIEAYLNHH